MILHPSQSDRPPARLPAAPPLDWPPAPVPEAPPADEPEGWAGWQVAVIAVVCLLGGALAGVILTDQAPLASSVQRSAPTPGPAEELPITNTPSATTPPQGPAMGDVGSEQLPIPAGLGYLFDEWAVGRWDVVLDAGDLMERFDATNRAPSAGHRFVLATTDLTYTGRASGDPADLKLYALDTDGQAYLEGCGRVPAPLLAPVQLSPGDTVTGQVCFEVPVGSVDGLLVVIEEHLGAPVHFALG